MKREESNLIKSNFIGSWYSSNDKIFDDLIDYFEINSHLHRQGMMGGGRIDHQNKKTTDITINPIDIEKKNNLIFRDYFSILFDCYNNYKKEWPFVAEKFQCVDIPSFNLQRYLPGDHFSKLHTERSAVPNMHRIFAWMTYLNNVSEEAEGCTYFSHFGIKIKPEKGKTLIWPAEWTHAHLGETLKKEKKYIITGWMCFPFN